MSGPTTALYLAINTPRIYPGLHLGHVTTALVDDVPVYVVVYSRVYPARVCLCLCSGEIRDLVTDQTAGVSQTLAVSFGVTRLPSHQPLFTVPDLHVCRCCRLNYLIELGLGGRELPLGFFFNTQP